MNAHSGEGADDRGGPRALVEERREVLTIEGLGFAGEGYVQLQADSDPRFVSVPHTLPGDQVEVRYLADPSRRRVWGELIAWISRSPLHRDPECPHYANCSGCAWRHRDSSAEREAKLAAAREILSRYGPPGGSDVPIGWCGDGVRDNHRLRARLRVTPSGCGLGLRSVGLDEFPVAIPECPAHCERVREVLAYVTSRLAEEPVVGLSHVEVRTWPGHTDGLLSFEGDIGPSAHRPSVYGRFVEWGDALGVSVVAVDGERVITLRGDATVRLVYPIGVGAVGTEVGAPRTAWYHATSHGHLAATWARAKLEGMPTGRGTLVDLCAGTGMVTLRLSDLFGRVIAVDEDRAALLALERGAMKAGLDHIEVRPGRVGSVLRKLRREVAPNITAAVINPMRRPLGAKQLRDLPSLRPERIVYLGPSPVSASKDARLLHACGYRLAAAAVIDLHPGTAQFMLGLVLVSV